MKRTSRSKKIKKGNQKGSNFEREVCKKISYWWTDDKNDDIFWRTSQSGGRATERRKSNLSTSNSAGDMCYLNVDGKLLIDLFLIELKRGYSNDVSALDFIDAKKKEPLLLKWWKKAEAERKENNRPFSLVIFKKDRHEICLMMDIELLHIIDEHSDCIVNSNEVYIRYDEYKLSIIKLDDFLKYCNRQTIETIAGS